MLADEPRAEMFLEHREEQLDSNRLREIVHATGFARPLAAVAEGARRHRHDRYRGGHRIACDAPGRFEAVEIIHLEIHEDDLRTIGPCALDRLDPAGRADRPDAGTL